MSQATTVAPHDPTAVTAPARPRSRRPRSRLWGILPWVAPATLTILFVFGYSLVGVFAQSLEYKGSWAGLDNFVIVISDPLFRTAILHNALLLLVVPVLVEVPPGRGQLHRVHALAGPFAGVLRQDRRHARR